jgi:hypothetical protein
MSQQALTIASRWQAERVLLSVIGSGVDDDASWLKMCNRV